MPQRLTRATPPAPRTPSRWRKRHFPRVDPGFRVNSILTVMELVALGLGVGMLPVFLAKNRPDLMTRTDVLDECQTELWLLTHRSRGTCAGCRRWIRTWRK